MKDFASSQSLWNHKQRCKLFPKSLNFLELDGMHPDNQPILNGSGSSADSVLDDNDSNIDGTESVIGEIDSHSSDNESVISETDSHSSENEELPQEVKEECEKFLDNKTVWEFIVKEANRDYEGDVLEAFKATVLLQRQLICNIPFQKVLMTMRKAMDNDDMDFEEALNYATKKRKFLIIKTAQEAKNELEKGDDDETEDGRGLYLSSKYKQ